jgi:hypothetical protein
MLWVHLSSAILKRTSIGGVDANCESGGLYLVQINLISLSSGQQAQDDQEMLERSAQVRRNIQRP